MSQHKIDRSLNGAMSRRAVLTRTAAFGTAIAIGSATFGKQSAASPRKGGNLRQGLAGGSATEASDPAVYSNEVLWNVGYQVGNFLVEPSPSGELLPELAERWDGSDDAKKWVFQLRKGVQFHNGKEFDSEDVLYTLNRHRAPGSKSGAAALLKGIASITATGPYEVTIELNAPNADLPFVMTDTHLWMQTEAVAPDSLIGTGAYVMKEVKPGVRYFATRNPNYFKSDRAWVDSVETITIDDPTARMSALLSNQVDIIDRVAPTLVDKLKQVSSVTVARTQGRGHYVFPMRCDIAPFDNPDLRLAVKYAADRESMVKRILAGYGTIGNDQPINAAYPLFSGDLPASSRDLDKAKFHLKKSGFDGVLQLQASDVAFSGAVDASQILQANCADIGLKVDVMRAPSASYWDEIWNKAPFCVSHWGGRATQDQFLSTVYSSDSPWNDTHWKRPDFDKLLQTGRAELDPLKRTQIYRDAALMIHDDGGALIPMFSDFLDAMSAKVKGYVVDPNFHMSGSRAAERVWLES